MATRLDRPYFQKSAIDMIDQRDFTESDKRSVGALALGELWTTQGVINQAMYLAEYSKDPKRQAAWLMGLSACTANDETTAEDITRAVSRGLSLEDASRLAVFTDSGEAARVLVELGVDWKSQTILPAHPVWANNDNRMDQPHGALVENLLDPGRANGRYHAYISPKLAIEVALEGQNFTRRKSNRFIEGVVASGLDPAFSLDTQALGLRSGKASLLSIAIASRAWPTASKLAEGSLSQDVLDEALLACAMSHGMVKHSMIEEAGEDKPLEALASALFSRGANPDRSFDFGTEALAFVVAQESFYPTSRAATARQWFLRGCLIENDDEGVDVALQASLCPLPLPPNPHGPWVDWALSIHDQVDFVSTIDNSPASCVLKFLLDNQLPAPAQAYELLEDAATSVGSSGNFDLLDGLLSSKAIELLHGKMDRPQFKALMDELLGVDEDGLLGEKAFSTRSRQRIWRNTRLSDLKALLSPSDRAIFEEALAPFIHELNQVYPKPPASTDEKGVRRPQINIPNVPKLPNASDEQYQVLIMTLNSGLEAFAAGAIAKPRPRRSL